MYCLRCDKISEIGELCCPKPIKLTAIGAIELPEKIVERAERVKECPFCGGMPVVERRVVDLGWSGIRTMMVLRCEKWDCPAGTGGCERFTFESAAVGWNTRKVVGDE